MFSATRARRISRPTQDEISERRASCHAPPAFLFYRGRTPAQRGAATCPWLPNKIGLSGGWDSQGGVECQEGRPGSCLRPAGGLPAQHLVSAPPPWLVGPELWGKSTAGRPGSYSSSWAWRGASAQCLLRVEPDTLWNGPRLVGDTPGAAAAPAMKLHSRGAWGVHPPRSREGGHKEGRAETRDVIRQQIVSRVSGWAASQKNRRGEARGVGMEQAGQCFTVLTIGVPTEEATSEQT